jgi:hypothetical protein
MKKSQKKLSLGAETIRTLRAQELQPVAGGYPTQTQLASGCTITTYTSVTVGCP